MTSPWHPLRAEQGVLFAPVRVQSMSGKSINSADILLYSTDLLSLALAMPIGMREQTKEALIDEQSFVATERRAKATGIVYSALLPLGNPGEFTAYARAQMASRSPLNQTEARGALEDLAEEVFADIAVRNRTRHLVDIRFDTVNLESSAGWIDLDVMNDAYILAGARKSLLQIPYEAIGAWYKLKFLQPLVAAYKAKDANQVYQLSKTLCSVNTGGRSAQLIRTVAQIIDKYGHLNVEKLDDFFDATADVITASATGEAKEVAEAFDRLTEVHNSFFTLSESDKYKLPAPRISI